jgi:hypothetical protein
MTETDNLQSNLICQWACQSHDSHRRESANFTPPVQVRSRGLADRCTVVDSALPFQRAPRKEHAMHMQRGFNLRFLLLRVSTLTHRDRDVQDRK